MRASKKKIIAAALETNLSCITTIFGYREISVCVCASYVAH